MYKMAKDDARNTTFITVLYLPQTIHSRQRNHFHNCVVPATDHTFTSTEPLSTLCCTCHRPYIHANGAFFIVSVQDHEQRWQTNHLSLVFCLPATDHRFMSTERLSSFYLDFLIFRLNYPLSLKESSLRGSSISLPMFLQTTYPLSVRKVDRRSVSKD
jgi:hypothetical protein